MTLPLDQNDIRDLQILIVDDKDAMRRLLVTVASGFGIKHIVTAENSIDAIASIEEKAPDIAIVDWEMPGMSGTDLVRWMRNHKHRIISTMPVIMLTGYDDRERIKKAREVGVTEFLAKPISVRALYQRITNCLKSTTDNSDGSTKIIKN